MTEDDIITLGNFCEVLMGDPSFNALCTRFKDKHIAHLFTSGPAETEAREHIYAKVMGVQEFLGDMAACIGQRDALMQERAAEAEAPELPDEPIDPFDD